MPEISLPPGRGTPLREAMGPLTLQVPPRVRARVAVIHEEVFHNPVGAPEVAVGTGEHYMVINMDADAPATVACSRAPGSDPVVYDPYRYEGTPRAPVDPVRFQKAHPTDVPPGYGDTLAKWYSVKFTYPDHNRIFLLPGRGISFQLHARRIEKWRVRRGEPIVIVGDRVAYEVPADARFTIPVGTLHTIINPHPDRIVFLEERYEGTFDEADITRVYNPNQYRPPG